MNQFSRLFVIFYLASTLHIKICTPAHLNTNVLNTHCIYCIFSLYIKEYLERGVMVLILPYMHAVWRLQNLAKYAINWSRVSVLVMEGPNEEVHTQLLYSFWKEKLFCESSLRPSFSVLHFLSSDWMRRFMDNQRRILDPVKHLWRSFF